MEKINKHAVLRLLAVIGRGLRSGAGSEPGDLCIEQAISYAIEGKRRGEGLGIPDHPECVARQIANYKIQINDSRWSSNQARANGLKKIGVAQLGSNELDHCEFLKRVGKKAGIQSWAVEGCSVAESVMDKARIEGKTWDAIPLYAAQIGLEVLQEMNSPGCKFLHLVK